MLAHWEQSISAKIVLLKWEEERNYCDEAAVEAAATSKRQRFCMFMDRVWVKLGNVNEVQYSILDVAG